MRKVLTHLSFYVLVAIIAGVLFGLYFPGKAQQLEPISKWFINIIKHQPT
jgi:aerobic C4-dicarboxylate transport protein